MKKTSALALLTLAVVVGTHMFVRQVHSWQAGTIPFTAIKTETHYKHPSGEISEVNTFVIGIRSDGSSAEVRTRVAPDGHQVEQKQIVDVGARKRVVIDGLTESLTTYPLSHEVTSRHAFVRLASCSERPDPERTEMLGFEVERSERQVEDGETVIKFETWHAADLGCLPMKQVVRTGVAGGSFSVASTADVTSLIRGEPPPSLFSVPEGPLVERSPGEVIAEFSRRYNRPLRGSGAAAMDESYFAHRALQQ